MPQKKLPPKLLDFMQQPFLPEINQLLDENMPVTQLLKVCKNKGYPIGRSYLTMYRQYRNSKSVEERYKEQYLAISPVKASIYTDANPLTKNEKLKSDLDFLDKVLQKGYEDFKGMLTDNSFTVGLDTAFKAIELKRKLVGEDTYGLTHAGVEYLQEITEEFYRRMIQYLLQFVPAEKRQEVCENMQRMEESYYAQTEYYEEYLRGRGYSEKEIGVKLRETRNHDSKPYPAATAQSS